MVSDSIAQDSRTEKKSYNVTFKRKVILYAEKIRREENSRVGLTKIGTIN